MSRPRVLLALLAAGLLGPLGACGGGGEQRAEPVSVWADETLRSVLPTRIGDVELRPTFAGSQQLTTRLSRGERPDVLLVDGETFPVWQPTADRMRGSRIVARDQLVLVARKPRVAGSAVGQPGARRLVAPREGIAGRLAGPLVADAGDALRSRNDVPDSTAALQVVRDNPELTALVVRSAVRRSRDRDRWDVAEVGGLGLTDVFVQTAYAEGSRGGAQVVRWLAGADARKRFRALGLDGPGANATVADCPAAGECG